MSPEMSEAQGGPAYQLGILEGKMAGMGREIGELKNDQRAMQDTLVENGKLLTQISSKIDSLHAELEDIKGNGCSRFEEAHAAARSTDPTGQTMGEFFGGAALAALKYLVVVAILGAVLSAFGLVFFQDKDPKPQSSIPSPSP